MDNFAGYIIHVFDSFYVKEKNWRLIIYHLELDEFR